MFGLGLVMCALYLFDTTGHTGWAWFLLVWGLLSAHDWPTK